MLTRLLRAFQRQPPVAPVSTGGRLLYAIGDVHGRLDLLDPLLELISHDAKARVGMPPTATQGADLQRLGDDRPALIFLGDYVDRGADSKGVIDRVIALEERGDFEVRALKGNHEGALLAFLDDPAFGPTWCEQGGAEAMASYGVSPPLLRSDAEGWSRACATLGESMPPGHMRFLAGLELMAVYGDYIFVHAGVRPGVPLEEQRESDLLWIRREFLTWERPFDKVVVHGHTPAEEAFLGDNRIGIDTGAYATGLLTAVRLMGSDRRLIQAKARHVR